MLSIRAPSNTAQARTPAASSAAALRPEHSADPPSPAATARVALAETAGPASLPAPPDGWPTAEALAAHPAVTLQRAGGGPLRDSGPQPVTLLHHPTLPWSFRLPLQPRQPLDAAETLTALLPQAQAYWAQVEALVLDRAAQTGPAPAGDLPWLAWSPVSGTAAQAAGPNARGSFVLNDAHDPLRATWVLLAELDVPEGSALALDAARLASRIGVRLLVHLSRAQPDAASCHGRILGLSTSGLHRIWRWSQEGRAPGAVADWPAEMRAEMARWMAQAQIDPGTLRIESVEPMGPARSTVPARDEPREERASGGGDARAAQDNGPTVFRLTGSAACTQDGTVRRWQAAWDGTAWRGHWRHRLVAHATGYAALQQLRLRPKPRPGAGAPTATPTSRPTLPSAVSGCLDFAVGTPGGNVRHPPLTVPGPQSTHEAQAAAIARGSEWFARLAAYGLDRTRLFRSAALPVRIVTCAVLDDATDGSAVNARVLPIGRPSGRAGPDRTPTEAADGADPTDALTPPQAIPSAVGTAPAGADKGAFMAVDGDGDGDADAPARSPAQTQESGQGNAKGSAHDRSQGPAPLAQPLSAGGASDGHTGTAPPQQAFGQQPLQLAVLFGAAESRHRLRARQSTHNNASRAHPQSLALDPHWAWHEFGHVLIYATTGELELPFAHSCGDTLAALAHAPGSPDRSDPQRAGLTFPWAPIRRRHDRDPARGWCFCGPRNGLRGSRWPRPGLFGGYIEEQMLSSALMRAYQALGGVTEAPSPATDAEISAAATARHDAADWLMHLLMRALWSLGSAHVVPARSVEHFVDALIQADAAAPAVWRSQGAGAWRQSDGRWHPELPVEPPPPPLQQPAPEAWWPGGSSSKVLRWAFEEQGAFTAPEGPRAGGRGGPPAVDWYWPGQGSRDAGDYAPTPLRWSEPGWWACPDALRAASKPATPGTLELALAQRGHRSDRAAHDPLALRVWWGWTAPDGRTVRWACGAPAQAGSIGPRRDVDAAGRLWLPIGAPPAGPRSGASRQGGGDDAANPPPDLLLAEISSPGDRALTDPALGLATAVAARALPPANCTHLMRLVAQDNNLGLWRLEAPVRRGLRSES